MKRSGAIWLVLGVIAVAALLMYFVVMPQIREGRSVQEIARTAEEAVEDVKKAVNDAGKEVEAVADGAEEAKAAALVKMARLGQDARAAADELQAVLEKSAPSAEEIAAAKAKLAAALKAASEFKLPPEADGTVAAAAGKVADGAKAALAALDKLPADPAAAKAALADLKTKLISVLPDTDAAEPAAADDAAKAETPADAAATAVPAFDILRVEKDGSTVIAGRAEPGSKVEIVNGDKVIASTKADTSGDFAAVLDNPLKAGDHSITLKSTSKDGKSTTSQEIATVSVPKDASGELLAMVTKPGEASKIIAMPENKEADAAANKGVTADKAAETANVDGAAPVRAEGTDTAKAVDDGSDAEVAVTTPDLPANSAEIASTPPVVAGDEPAARTEAEQVAKADPASAETPADTARSDGKQPAAMPEVLVSAVELEGDKIFIAGNTRPGATVRVYADDRIVAETRADDGGRFVADGTIKLAVGNHTIRADVLSADGARVEFRASVPFFRPEGDLAAVASADAAKDMPAIEPLANGAFDKARDEAGKALALLKGLYAAGRTPTAEELAAARSSAEIALKSLADVRVSADVDPALAAMAAAASKEAGKALERLKAVPADVAAFKSALGDVEAIVASAVKPASAVARADDADAASKRPAADNAAADPAKAASEQETAEGVDKAGDQVSADDVQVTAKVDRLAKQSETGAKDIGTDASPPAAVDGDAASAGSRTAGDDAAATGDQAVSGDTASADQPKLIEQAPLKQSDGSVIIRRGDTLWQISRRVYGKGVRYTTIYVANKPQIEDPDRIMPGQIFTMPGQWLENAEELHKERLQHGHRSR